MRNTSNLTIDDTCINIMPGQHIVEIRKPAPDSRFASSPACSMETDCVMYATRRNPRATQSGASRKSV